MLYDPKWQKPEVKADPFSLESLIAWLEKQPANDRYNYLCAGECLIAQYLKAQGVAEFEIRWLDRDGPAGWNDIAQGVNHDDKWTFGAALARARALAA